MDRFGTFKVDHTNMEPGIYNARDMLLGHTNVVTLDIRTCIPYEDNVIDNVTIHSVEHILATTLEEETRLRKVYFGPMGCQTGYYLLVANTENEITPELVGIVLVEAIEKWDRATVPYDTQYECGNNRTLARGTAQIGAVREQMNKIHSLATKLIENKEYSKYNYL